MPLENLQSPNPEERGALVVGEERRTRSKIEFLRSRFIAGLITVIPAFITIWVINALLRLLNQSVGGRFIRDQIDRLFKYFAWPDAYATPLTITILLILIIAFVLAVGILTRFLFVRRMILIGEGIVGKIPLIRFFYVTPKEVLRTLTRTKKTEKRVVVIEFPRKGVWAIAYATGELHQQPDNRHVISVFVPTTPNPTSGFLLLVGADEVYDINLTTEGAVRFIISGGILSPHNVHLAPFAGFDKRPDLPPPDPLVMDMHTIENPSGEFLK